MSPHSGVDAAEAAEGIRSCPACGRLYEGDAAFCHADGRALVMVTPSAPLPPGNDDKRGELVLGRYQLRRAIADGGTGRVYEALDLHQPRRVAVKMLYADLAQDEVQVERLRREFKVSRLLSHEHVVDVIDFQATADQPVALVMEYLTGETLRGVLGRAQTLPPARLVRMLSQLALALDRAHAVNLVHRDLKPDNIFLCQTRQGDLVKVLDFGSVKDKRDTKSHLTVLGTTLGSPYYMSPEQAQGLDSLDRRADVWALSAIVYECVSGRVPFIGNRNIATILLEIVTKDPAPLTSTTHVVPPALQRVVAAGLTKPVDQRLGSVSELANAVGQAYGLSGAHTEWAYTDEGTLRAAIDRSVAEPAFPVRSAALASRPQALTARAQRSLDAALRHVLHAVRSLGWSWSRNTWRVLAVSVLLGLAFAGLVLGILEI